MFFFYSSSIDFFTGNGFIVPFTVDVISSIISETAKVGGCVPGCEWVCP